MISVIILHCYRFLYKGIVLHSIEERHVPLLGNSSKEISVIHLLYLGSHKEIKPISLCWWAFSGMGHIPFISKDIWGATRLHLLLVWNQEPSSQAFRHAPKMFTASPQTEVPTTLLRRLRRNRLPTIRRSSRSLLPNEHCRRTILTWRARIARQPC